MTNLDQPDSPDPAFAMEMLHHVEGLIALGESRANILAAGNAALLVLYSSTDFVDERFPACWLFGPNWPVIFALFAVSFAILSLMPQRKSTLLPSGTTPSSYFFGCIADMPLTDFISDYEERKTNEHTEMVLNAVHMRSRKAQEKFTYLWAATIFSVIQFLPAIVHAVF